MHAYDLDGTPDRSGYAPGRLAIALCGLETVVAEFTGRTVIRRHCTACDALATKGGGSSNG